MILYMIQAILFSRNDFTLQECHDFMKIHDLHPIKKVHKTQYFRFRLMEPDTSRYSYRFKTISPEPKLIRIIVAFNKKY